MACLSDKLASRAARVAASTLLALAAAGPLHAQEQDPLKSPACGEALAHLQAAREAHEAAHRVESLRAQAARTCLGSAALPRRPSRVAQAPISVAPTQIGLTPQPAPLAPPSLPPPPVSVPRLPQPAQCDPGGCWLNNGGSHLQYVPPALAGPQGGCVRQGGLVYCP